MPARGKNHQERKQRLPAEWEPHRATWLAWPHIHSDWPGRFSPIPWVYAEIIRHLSRVEQVRMIVRDQPMKTRVERILKRVGVDPDRVDYHRMPTDRSWLRDSGPIFVKKRSSLEVLDFCFNGWAKYSNHRRDDRVPARVARALGLTRIQPRVGAGRRSRRMVLEGGSIDGNGRGTILTTEECLLSRVQERNPGMTRGEVEAALKKYLGARKVLWLGKGIAGDDSHGHIDDLARFVGPRTVVAAVEGDPSDLNYAPLRENLGRLRSMTDQDGKPLQVIPLPMPRPITLDGHRLPASYANFYMANGLVLVPTFNDPSDRKALSILARQFPDREVVGIHSSDLVWGLGTLHCMTREEPA